MFCLFNFCLTGNEDPGDYIIIILSGPWRVNSTKVVWTLVSKSEKDYEYTFCENPGDSWPACGPF